VQSEGTGTGRSHLGGMIYGSSGMIKPLCQCRGRADRREEEVWRRGVEASLIVEPRLIVGGGQ